jgi:uncharacterized protein YkwD
MNRFQTWPQGRLRVVTARADRLGVVLCRRTFLLAFATAWACRQTAPAPRQADDARLTDIEWHIRFVTNQHRNWQKLPPLAASTALAAVARAHSRDMLERGFFDHRTPEGLGPRDRVTRQGLTFSIVAENIYSTRDGTMDPAELASLIVSGWMKSEGHRRNILDPALTTLGVGVATSDRVVLATQVFGG